MPLLTRRALAALAVLLVASRASAQEDVPIQRNDYDIQFYQGPLIAPIRVTGLGGAYTGYAEGVDPAIAAAGPQPA